MGTPRKHIDEYLEKINKLLAEAHADGHQLYIDTGTAVKHWLPWINPCADSPQIVQGVDEPLPWWKVIVRRIAEGVATDCRCCNGMRILVVGIAGYVIGWLVG